MINNRQNRRRGRGPRNTGGNRNDNRSRGNATQLLDKYKGLARDAQMSGDRVQAEYYLQYADHYFRVLEEHKAAQDEKQAKHQGNRRNDGDEGDDGGNEQYEKKPRRKPKLQDQGDSGEDKPKRTRKPKAEDSEASDIAAALPPAIGADEDKPKRRRRKADDDDSEAADAA